MSEITGVTAREILDSRGHPTVRAEVSTPDGVGEFKVPAGASTGRFEAVERRDGGEHFNGLGVTEVVATIEDDLADVVVGRDVTNQSGIDAELERADGTDNFTQLGANAVLAISGATLHAASAVANLPLHRYLSDTYDVDVSLPTPMVNILSGGLHAEGGIEIQDFLVIPTGAHTYSDALEMVWDVRESVRTLIIEANHRPLVADEGGFAPPMEEIGDAFDLLLRGIDRAGYITDDEVAIAMDVAASHFYDAESEIYRLESIDHSLTRDEMISIVSEWTDSYPVISLEDPLAEDDWEGWSRLSDQIDDNIQLLGDDLIATNRDRLTRAVEQEVASAVLVKPNQAGTITRAVNAVFDAKEAGFESVVSARSGETCDTTIADLAAGLDTGQIKIGSLARSERLAKYNRLLDIERGNSYQLKNPLAN